MSALLRGRFFACVLALAGLLPMQAGATAQEPDVLVLYGETLDLQTNPLDGLIEAKTVQLPKPGSVPSSNWRGYVAKWEVRDAQLVLVAILMRLSSTGWDQERSNVLSQVFAGKTEVPADWYSGALVLPRGKLVDYVHLGYGSTFERYTVLRIKHGKVTGRDDLDAQGFTALRKKQFARYQKTPEYEKEFQETRKTLTAKEAEGFLYQISVERYMAMEP